MDAETNPDANYIDNFAYTYSVSSEIVFEISSVTLDDPGTWWYQTISQVNNANNLQIIAFNDDKPETEKETSAD